MGRIGVSGEKRATMYADGLSTYPRFASAATCSGARSALRGIGSKALNHSSGAMPPTSRSGGAVDPEYAEIIAEIRHFSKYAIKEGVVPGS